VDLLSEREEEFHKLAVAFQSMHDALDARFGELQDEYERHLYGSVVQVQGCISQIEELIERIGEIERENRFSME